MARILFGVAGEGFGHATRAEVVIRYLQRRGHKVKVITYHKGYQELSRHPDIQTIKVFGLRFGHKAGKTSYWKTVLVNLKRTREAKNSFFRVKKLIKKFKPDLVITDLEPWSSLFATLYKIPLISIDNQHRINRGKLEIKNKWLANYLLNKIGVSTIAPRAEAYIIITFFKFKVTKPKTYLVPPVLRPEIIQAIPRVGEHILVYDTTHSADIVKILRSVPGQFIVYGHNYSRKIDNCLFRKNDQKKFLQDLISARAVIASAGMTLISEALQLEKPYLALPVAGRIEQLVNAHYLKKLGFGDYQEQLSSEGVKKFLAKLPDYRQNLKHYPKMKNNDKLYKTLDKILSKILSTSANR